jgi:hypothetical protein
LMLDEVPGPINQQQRHSLNDIHASSQRLLKLVNEYLEHPDWNAKTLFKPPVKTGSTP